MGTTKVFVEYVVAHPELLPAVVSGHRLLNRLNERLQSLGERTGRKLIVWIYDLAPEGKYRFFRILHDAPDAYPNYHRLAVELRDRRNSELLARLDESVTSVERPLAALRLLSPEEQADFQSRIAGDTFVRVITEGTEGASTPATSPGAPAS